MEIHFPTLILRNLLTNETYTRAVIPHLKKEYFESTHKLLFNSIAGYVGKYYNLPNQHQLTIEFGETHGLTEGSYQEGTALLSQMYNENTAPEDLDWMLTKTEKWCQDRALHLAILDAVQVIDGKDQNRSKDALPSMLQEALAVSFDKSVGHDYLEDASKRYDLLTQDVDKVPFDLDSFNEITKGGFWAKTLNICLAGTGVGKSLFMCHVAAAALAAGKNVLYITMEMAEEKISERIDANLMDVEISKISEMKKDTYISRIDGLRNIINGKLIVKEYPTGGAHVGHFRALLSELSIKKNFKPDIIFIDYLNICASSRIRAMGGSINSYSYVKSIAEELRGLAVEYAVPVVSATQTTRTGFGNTDVGLEDTSESFGLPATADFMFALITSEELQKLGQFMVKQLKSRYDDINRKKVFVIGVDKAKMKLFDVEKSGQTLIDENSVPIMDANFGDWKI